MFVRQRPCDLAPRERTAPPRLARAVVVLVDDGLESRRNDMRERVAIVRCALAHVDVDADGTGAYLVDVVATYFSYLYGVSTTTFLPSDDGATGCALDVERRTLHVHFDPYRIKRAVACAEALRPHRVVVNDYSLRRYESDSEKRVYTALAFVMYVENFVMPELRRVTCERTLVEIMF